MTATTQTQAAKLAIAGGQINLIQANKLEDMARLSLDAGQALASPGDSVDAFTLATGSSAYHGLSSAERAAFKPVFDELLAATSSALATAAPASEANTPSPTRVLAAVNEFQNIVSLALSSGGPGQPLDAPGLDLAAHPAEILRSAFHIQEWLHGTHPYVVATYDTSALPEQRTRTQLAAKDITPGSFLAALRSLAAGEFADVPVAVQSIQDYEANGPGQPTRDVGSNAPPESPAGGPKPGTLTAIEDVRFSEMHISGVKQAITAALEQDPWAAATFDASQLAALTSSILSFKNNTKSVAQIITDFSTSASVSSGRPVGDLDSDSASV